MSKELPAWVRCVNNVMQMVSPGGGDGGTQQAPLTIGDEGHYYPKYLFVPVEEPTNPWEGRLTATFVQAVRERWGRSEAVAKAALDEIFRHDDNLGFGTDHDDQVRDAMRIGVLAGRLETGTPEGFVEAFCHMNDER